MLAFAYARDYLEGRCGISLMADHRFFAAAISFMVADRSSGIGLCRCALNHPSAKVGSQ